MQNTISEITDVIGNIPYRMALGRWVDRPAIFIKTKPSPTWFDGRGIACLPNVRFMDRSGMGTSTTHRCHKTVGRQVA